MNKALKLSKFHFPYLENKNKTIYFLELVQEWIVIEITSKIISVKDFRKL